MAEPWGAFGEVPFEALVLRSSWGLEGCEGLRESQVMGAVLPPMGPVSLPLHLFWFGIWSSSLAPFLQIPGFPLESHGAQGFSGWHIPSGMWDEKVPSWSCRQHAQGSSSGNHIGIWLFPAKLEAASPATSAQGQGTCQGLG